jgi:hypothetical protein
LINGRFLLNPSGKRLFVLDPELLLLEDKKVKGKGT